MRWIRASVKVMKSGVMHTGPETYVGEVIPSRYVHLTSRLKDCGLPQPKGGLH